MLYKPENGHNLSSYIDKLKCLNEFNITFFRYKAFDLTLHDLKNFQKNTTGKCGSCYCRYESYHCTCFMLITAYNNDKMSWNVTKQLKVNK